MKRFALLVLLSVMILCTLGAQDYFFEHIDIAIEVGLDNSYHIEERIVANFSTPRHGIYREIPVKFGRVRTTVEDLKSSEPITRDSVSPDWVTFRLGSADRTVSGLKEYRLSYTYHIGDDRTSEWDEFYYNLLGDGWQAPIKEFVFAVTFPKAVDPSMVFLTGGAYGSTSQRGEYSISDDGQTITGAAQNLSSGEALTLRVQMEEGYFSEVIPFVDRTVPTQPQNGLFLPYQWANVLSEDERNLHEYLTSGREGEDKTASIRASVPLVQRINEELHAYGMEREALSEYYFDLYRLEEAAILAQEPLIWETDDLFTQRLEQEMDESLDRYNRAFDSAHTALLEPYQQKLHEHLSLLTEADTRLKTKESIHLCGEGGVSYVPYLRNERLWPATLTVSDSLIGEFTVDVVIDFVGLVQSEEEIRFSIIDFDKAVKANQLCWELAYHVIPDTRIDDEGVLEIVRFLFVLDAIRVSGLHANTLFQRVFVDPILIRAITVDENLRFIDCTDDREPGFEAAGYTDWFGNSGTLRSRTQHFLLADPLTTIDMGYEQERLSVLGPSIVVTADTVACDAATEYFAALSASNNMMASAELKAMLDDNPDAVVLVDIRSAADFEAGHIVGSTHVAWAQFAAVLPSLSKSEKIVIVCFSGQTAGQTVGVLRTLGYDAYSLQGGMNNGWKPAKLPMAKYP